MLYAANNASTNMLRFSIIVPSYNQARFIRRTLDSILAQDYRPLQVIVADGASTDGTQEILAEYAVQYSEVEWLSEPDDGPADAVNKGLQRVTGDIVGIQSSDDVYYPGAFRRVGQVFQDQPECGFVYGDLEGIDEDDNLLFERIFPDFSWEAFFAISMSIGQSSVFFRRSVAEQVGGWDPRYYGCDLDYWLRLLFRTQALRIPYTLSGWRCYPGQRTGPETARQIWDGYWATIDESPDLAASPLRIRRLAAASKHLLAMRYPPKPSRWLVRRHMLIGLFLHPTFWRYNPRSRYLSWVPGVPILRRFIRRSRPRSQEESKAWPSTSSTSNSKNL